MNEVDPSRSDIKQLDHDVRGMRMGMDELGRRVVKMEKILDRLDQNDKRRTWIERTIIGSAITVAVGAIGAAFTWIAKQMGKE